MKQSTAKYQFTASPLRFRRWSRKGYAAFVSRQKAVTIGQLAAHVSERFQTKNSSLHASVGCDSDRRVDSEDISSHSEESELDLVTLWNELQQFILIGHSLSAKIASHPFDSDINKHSDKAEDEPIIHGFIFRFFYAQIKSF